MSDLINSDINNSDIATHDVVTVDISRKPSSKNKFEKACGHCNKILKNAKTYDTHTKQQVCYSKNELTYCKLCDITLTNNAEYIKHLLSMDHINKIGCNKLEVLHSNQPSTILQADPYLSNNEARSIGTNNLGNKFTFVFENNETQTVNLVQNDNQQINTTQTPEPINKQKYEPTPKQLKIISLLENMGNIMEGTKLLLVMLDHKLNMEDYYGLQNIIKNAGNMKPDYKKAYLDTIDKFVNMIVSRKTKGEQTYKDKDISKLVISLTI